MDRESEARIDLGLVTRAVLKDDRHAFEQLVRRHQGYVRAQLRQLCGGDAAWSDDLAQETFIQAWLKLRLFRAEARFSTWLYRIAYNCFLQARRRGDAELQSSADETTDASEHQDHSVSLGLDLNYALQRLPIGERSVLVYHLQAGLSHEETAQITGLPLGTVKTHALRGKAKLRTFLEDYNSASNCGESL